MFAGVTPAGRARTNWYVPASDHLAIGSPRDLLDALDGWPSQIREAVAATPSEHVLRHPLADLPPVARYSRDTVALVGDAAHAMAPSLGRGACQAIDDALALTEALDRTGRTERTERPAGLAAVLAGYDRAQRPVGTRLVRRSRQLLRLQLSPRLAPLRDAVLRVVEPVSPR